LENLVIDSEFWRGRRVFVTGHTGFKGAWLSMMLSRLCAQATGYALAPPTRPNLFALAGIGEVIDDHRGDVRDLDSLTRAMAAARPEIVIHLAAQPLVRRSYFDPVETFQTNVMGVVNVLEAARSVESLRAVIIVTTDKCYENREWLWGYRETDRLGGRDPYSNSKACAELAASSYRASFFSGGACVATARAGNVIGGGDFAADRIVPDAVRAILGDQELRVRAPRAVRPWQHALEPLIGYLLLAQKAYLAPAAYAEAWNFGPGAESERPVKDLLDRFMPCWGAEARWRADEAEHPHEAGLLRLDASKARERLGWRPRLSFDETIDWTADWYRAFAAGGDMRALSLAQTDAYLGQWVRLVSPFQPGANYLEDMDHAAQRIA
jgi:CDP-glucose 4,6-dehydratase